MPSANILFIDDEASFDDRIRRFLKKETDANYYSLEFVRNGLEGLAKIQKNHFDAVILDIRMPEMDGIELIGELDKKQLTPSIVIVSAYCDIYERELAEIGRKKNVFGLLTKTRFTAKEFKNKIDYVLEQNNIPPFVEQKPEIKIEQFSYENLDKHQASEIKEKTNIIKGIVKKTQENYIALGVYFREVKQKLPYGKFESWLYTEFNDTMSRTTVGRLMAISEKFERIDSTALRNIPLSAMYTLTSSWISEEIFDEIIESASEGKIYSEKEIKKIVLDAKPTEIENKDKNEDEQIKSSLVNLSSSHSPDSAKTAPPKIIGNLISKTDNCWQLGKHLLYCGNPNSPRFKKLITNNISLAIIFPPREDWGLDLISAHSKAIFYSDRQDLDSQAIRENVEAALKTYTESDELVIFGYLSDPYLLKIAHDLDCQCFIAEPDKDKCQAIIDFWQQQGHEIITRTI